MAVTSVAFSPDGHLIAAGSDYTTVILWDAASGYVTRKFDGDPSYVTPAALQSRRQPRLRPQLPTPGSTSSTSPAANCCAPWRVTR